MPVLVLSLQTQEWQTMNCSAQHLKHEKAIDIDSYTPLFEMSKSKRIITNKREVQFIYITEQERLFPPSRQILFIELHSDLDSMR